MTKRSTTMAVGASTLILATAAAAIIGTGHKLSNTRDSTEAAWREIAAIHAARARAAQAALNAAAPSVNPELLRQVRGELELTLAASPNPALLDDPVLINAYKRQQGELTGKLFMLAAGDAAQAGALGQLRARLPRDEAALAQARARYRQASADYNALSRTTIAALLGYRALPDAL
jgi:hypothetical protein